MRKVTEKKGRLFHGGDRNEYFSSQAVAATLRAEWCLPLHVCINKMFAIPKQKGLHTAA